MNGPKLGLGVRWKSPSDMPPGFPQQTNEKGQVVTKTTLLKQMEELIEEPGLTCCICREGYKFQVQLWACAWRPSCSLALVVALACRPFVLRLAKACFSATLL